MASVGALCSGHELREPASSPLGVPLTSIADLNSCTGSVKLDLRLIDLGATLSRHLFNHHKVVAFEASFEHQRNFLSSWTI